MKKSLILLLIVVFIVSLLPSCSKTTAKPSVTSEESGQAKNQEEQAHTEKMSLLIGHWGDPPSLDPNNALNDCSMRVTTNVYDTLIRMNSKFEAEACLAESWVVSDDGLRYTFKIRPGVKFHNGDLLTVEDVLFSIERGLSMPKASPSYSQVDHAEIVDNEHVTIYLKAPLNIALAKLALPFGPIVNKKYVEEIGDEEFGRKPMGTGPFRFVKWIKGERVILEANEDYFKGAPAIKKVELITIPDTSAAILNLESGDIDCYCDILTSDYAIAKKNDNLRINEGPALGFEFIEFNCGKEPFNNPKVRQAVCYAIDKKGMLSGINDNIGKVIDTVVLEDAVGYTEDIKKYDFNLEKAKELLAEAGYPKGFECEIHTYMDLYAKYAQVLQSSLTEIGIKATIKQEEVSAHKLSRQSGKYDISIGGSSFTAMDVFEACADSVMNTLIGKTNLSFYDNEHLTELLAESQLTSDKEKLAKLYSEVLQILAEDVPFAPLIWRVRNVAAKKNLVIPFVDPYGFHYIYEWHWES